MLNFLESTALFVNLPIDLLIICISCLVDWFVSVCNAVNILVSDIFKSSLTSSWTPNLTSKYPKKVGNKTHCHVPPRPSVEKRASESADQATLGHDRMLIYVFLTRYDVKLSSINRLYRQPIFQLMLIFFKRYCHLSIFFYRTNELTRHRL